MCYKLGVCLWQPSRVPYLGKRLVEWQQYTSSLEPLESEVGSGLWACCHGNVPSNAPKFTTREVRVQKVNLCVLHVCIHPLECAYIYTIHRHVCVTCTVYVHVHVCVYMCAVVGPGILYMTTEISFLFKEKVSCLRWDSNTHHWSSLCSYH